MRLCNFCSSHLWCVLCVCGKREIFALAQFVIYGTYLVVLQRFSGFHTNWKILRVSPEYIKSSSRSHIAASSIKLICGAKYIFPKMLSWPDFRCVPKALLKYYDPISLLVDTVSIIYKIINDFTLFNFITLKSCQSTQ